MEVYAASFRKETGNPDSGRRARARATVRIAVAAALCALSTAILFLGVALGVLDLSALAVVSFATAFCVMEMGGAYPYLLWLVTSVLLFIFLPDKLVFFEYAFFAGVYPVVKFAAARQKTAVGIVIKLVFFNAAVTALALISHFVLGLPEDAGLSFGWVLYVVGNALFLLYDMALSSVCAFYLLRLRKHLRADWL